MAILLSDTLDVNQSGNFDYIVPEKTNYTFGGVGDGVTVRRVTGQDGNYDGGGVISKRSFVFRPPLFVQFDFRKTPNVGSVFAFAGVTVSQRPMDYYLGAVKGYGVELATDDVSSFGAITTGGSLILDPVVIGDWYTFKMEFTPSEVMIYFGASGGALDPQTSVGYTFDSGNLNFGDPCWLHLGTPFFQTSGIGYRNVIISSTPFESQEDVTSYDPHMRQLYG